MPSYTTTDIRNLALVGHGGTGKTSLAEALLVAGGAIHTAGQVEKGNTVADHTDEEKERGASVYSSVMHCDHEGHRINIIDTPGGADFVGQAIGPLYGVETAVVVINAANGIESGTRRMMERAKSANLCRMIVVNRIDAEDVDPAGVVAAIQESFGSECLPINLPTGGGTGVIGCFAITEGDSDLGPVSEAHTKIVEQVIEMDDALVEKYFEEGELPVEELHGVFERALREGHLVPICFTAATANVGVPELLSVIEKYMPNPCEGNKRVFLDGDGNEVTAEADASKDTIAHTFKVVNDRFGKLGVFRVFQGKVSRDSPVYIADGKKPAKLSHVYSLQGGEHVETDAAIAGDICAVIKVEEMDIGKVLKSGNGNAWKLKGEVYPKPMVGKAITPAKRGDEGKLGDALTKLSSEDPTVLIERDPQTHETVMYGVGEQHLRLVLDKMKSKYGVEVETAPPKIAYKETVTAYAEGHHRHKKQTGGAGQFGEVYCKVEPIPEEEREEVGAGLDFVDELVGESIPRGFLPAIRKGVEQALTGGALAGYPVEGVRVRIYDGKHHPVDSKEVAFVTAGKRAFLDAFHKAKPVLLEPMVTLEVTVPNANMGDITGDLSGKRGRVLGTDMLPGDLSVVKAVAPLAEVSNYQSQLKSVTGGQGSFTMEFSHYDPVPGNVQQQIVAQYKPKDEED